jgi:Zn-dependent protease
MLNNPLLDIGLLIIVIFIHELGHLVMMKSLGYKDVRMFFIPFFGAAVTGKKENTNGLSGALIALAGPVPGIIFSLIVLSIGSTNAILIKYANISLFINVLNLLPIVPLDGGKFFFYTLLCRNETAEIIFTVLSSLLLLVLAVIFRNIFFGIIVIINFISVFNIEKEWKVVKAFKDKVLENNFISIIKAPLEFQKSFIDNVSKSFPKINNDATLAKIVSNIWERIVFKVPNVFLSLGLIFSYVLLLVLVVKVIIASHT